MRRRGLFWMLVAVTLVFYGLMVFWTLPAITQAAGGLMPFDLRPTGYGLDQARALLSALDGETRAFYMGTQHWLDLFFPPLLGAVLVWATLWAWQNTASVVRGLLIVPALVAVPFDWLENARIAGLLRAAEATDAAILAACFATVAKSLSAGLAIVILLIGLMSVCWRRFKGVAP